MFETDTFIAPWALANEPFPILLSWRPAGGCDMVEISLPPEMVIHEVFNGLIEKRDGGYRILGDEDWDYLALKMSQNQVNEEAVRKIPIEISFRKGSDEVAHKRLRATIIRPVLALEGQPETLVLEDKMDLESLISFKLRHSGFGEVIINVTVEAQGRIVSRKEVFLEDLFRRLISAGYVQTEEAEEPAVEGVSVEEEMVERIAADLEEMIKNPSIADVSSDQLKEFTEFLREKGTDEFFRILSSHVATLIADYFIRMFRTYPSDHATLEGGPTDAIISGSIEELSVKFAYKDPVGNTYDELQSHVQVKDARSRAGPTTIPINVEIHQDLTTDI